MNVRHPSTPQAPPPNLAQVLMTSAKDLNRPALKRLRNDARTGKFNQIIYTKMDRLSRSLRDHLLLSDEFEELNIITKSKSEPFIGDGVMGRMFHQMLEMLRTLHQMLEMLRMLPSNVRNVKNVTSNVRNVRNVNIKC